VEVLYDGWLPRYHAKDDRPVQPLLLHGACVVLRRAWHRDDIASRVEQASLRRFLRRHDVAAVLAEYGPTAVSVADACFAAGIPLVAHFHGADAFDHETLELFGPHYLRVLPRCAAVIAVSHEMVRQLRELGAPAERLHYNPCGIDTVLFSGADPAVSDPLFFAAGRFVDKKAPHLTLLAFKQVAEACPAARLVMAGDGHLWEACKQLARALGIDDVVEFAGPLPHPQIAARMQAARAFVQHSLKTSYGDSEGTPVSILEAGAIGLPVVSTRHGGISDVVVHEETGLLVDEGDVSGMAASMIRLANSPTLAAELGERARHHVRANFSMEKSIANLWGILERAIGGRRS
jgi:glycosyltransferase involved in cell wall biosynthesis